jgi:hypothetical protein
LRNKKEKINRKKLLTFSSSLKLNLMKINLI